MLTLPPCVIRDGRRPFRAVSTAHRRAQPGLFWPDTRASRAGKSKARPGREGPARAWRRRDAERASIVHAFSRPCRPGPSQPLPSLSSVLGPTGRGPGGRAGGRQGNVRRVRCWGGSEAGARAAAGSIQGGGCLIAEGGAERRGGGSSNPLDRGLPHQGTPPGARPWLLEPAQGREKRSRGDPPAPREAGRQIRPCLAQI